MSTLLIVILVIVLLGGGFGYSYNGGAYRGYALPGLGSILLILLVLYLLKVI